MSGAIIFPPRFRFSLGMKTLIPWAVDWNMPFLLSTTLLFLPYRPSHPSLTEIAVSPLCHHCRGSTGFGNAGMSCLCSDTRLQCLGKSRRRVAGTGMWEGPGQPIPVFGTGSGKVLGSRVPSLDKTGMPEKWQMQAGGQGERGGWLSANVDVPFAESSHCMWLWMLQPPLSCSSAFPLTLPALALEAALPEALHISAVEREGVVSFLVLMKWVIFQQSPLERRLLLPNWGAWCCSDVTLLSLQSSRISTEETNCFKHEGKH